MSHERLNEIVKQRWADKEQTIKYPGIPYHYGIHQDGSIEQYHNWDEVTWHAERWNFESVGIVLYGNFIEGASPTKHQLDSLTWLTESLEHDTRGHKELVATECPGKWWDEWKLTLV